MSAPSRYTTADDWLQRIKPAGGRIKVNGIPMRLHPDCKPCERCRDLWSEIHGVDHLDRWAEVETMVERAVGAVASWNDWPVRGRCRSERSLGIGTDDVGSGASGRLGLGTSPLRPPSSGSGWPTASSSPPSGGIGSGVSVPGEVGMFDIETSCLQRKRQGSEAVPARNRHALAGR
jgi:hypothetical protein